MNTDYFAYLNESPFPSSGEGKLQGMRIALHPSIAAREWPSEAGSRALEGFIALEDATVVERLKSAGAHIRGNTFMNELGLGVDMDTSGSAVAEGEADLSVVVDIMGESRIIAARAGLAGFKPSFGIVSRLGVIGLVPSMESVGFTAGRPEDILEVLSVTAGDDGRDYSLSVDMPDFSDVASGKGENFRLGVISEASNLLDSRELDEFGKCVGRLKEAGCAINELSFGEFDLFATVHQVIGSVEASSCAGKFDGVRYGHRAGGAKDWNDMYLRSRGESFGTMLKTLLFQGAWFQFENYGAFEKACRVRSRLLEAMDKLYESVDFLVLPTCGMKHMEGKAENIAGLYDMCRLALPANVTGQPALNLPGRLLGVETGLSIQVMGRRLDDTRLLAWASSLVGRIFSGDKT
ncbi:MAG: amidase family protein [Syntrophales bacterium]|nr:amidase family protein [Syntrophales bacterium]